MESGSALWTEPPPPPAESLKSASSALELLSWRWLYGFKSPGDLDISIKHRPNTQSLELRHTSQHVLRLPASAGSLGDRCRPHAGHIGDTFPQDTVHSHSFSPCWQGWDISLEMDGNLHVRSPMRERDLLQTCGDALTPDTCLMPQEGRTKQFILELIVEFHSETVYRIKIARFCTDYSHLRLVMNSERPNSEHSNSREGGRWCDRGPTRWEWERECVPRVVWAGPKELSSDALRRPRERGTVQSVGGHRRQ
ncbi:uncharacterized protein LOC125090298 isoform X1 [Lutra lutra]|uniref:uncharacterized protein LOC125090298 isoform X1 n=1 Tax=Lutra lutra TaxID=9657 RepID=UPI001FD2C7FA|nr:uncharacterized protein LOC125090298 isoform X1 [Lutra lutra]